MPRSWVTPVCIALLAIAAIALTFATRGYTHFIIALVALTIITGVGLNILLGLAGQISLGHIGFYAIGAYTVAILMLRDVSFWIAFPLAGFIAGGIGFVLALPALRVAGPYLAMVTIAFAFIVQHGTIEWRGLTGGANGLIGLPAPTLGKLTFGEREIALLAIVVSAVSLFFFDSLAKSRWGRGMIAVRDSEIAAGSLGYNPVAIKTTAFALSAVFAGLAGGLFSPLLMFVAPDSFPFSQSILFLLAVIIGGAGFTFGPVLGALVSVLLPEMLSGLAEYRLLFFGALLLVVLWLAPEGIIGTVQRFMPRAASRSGEGTFPDVAAVLGETAREQLVVSDISLSFGGVKASQNVSFMAAPGEVTSVIGPNGAGKTTVLNIVSGFYKPDSGSITLGKDELAGRSSAEIARLGIARTYQTTRLFDTLSVIENVIAGLHKGKLGWLLSKSASANEIAHARSLLNFVGYKGALDIPASDLAHIDKRLVEIACALATRPKVLLLDEPAAGLMRSDKTALSALLREIANLGIAVVLVEHDMTLVMSISDRITVLDAGRIIAQGTPQDVRSDPKVIKAYLGDSGLRHRPRSGASTVSPEPILTVLRLQAGYAGAPVIDDLSFDVRAGEVVALLGANGAGKSTTMRALSGLLPPKNGEIVLNDNRIERLEAFKIARRGLALVPEGRQVFPELSVRDNLVLGAHTQKAEVGADIERMLTLFPRLRERIDNRAGLLSGGEQQMLAIARGLMARPTILLLDEPSLGLAPAIANEVFDTLAELRDSGVTILLVDQMAAQALTVADRGYVLETGRIVQQGGAQALANDPSLAAAYLGADTSR